MDIWRQSDGCWTRQARVRDINMVNVSVLVLDLNRADDTIECVNRVLASDNVTINVYVLTNGSHTSHRDKIARCFAGDKRVLLHHSPVNLGFTGGMNCLYRQVISQSEIPDYLLLLNNDAFVFPETVTAMQQVLDRNPQSGIACPTVVSVTDNDMIMESGLHVSLWLMQQRPLHAGKRLMNLGATEVRSMPVANGTCMLIRTSLYTRLGGLDDRYFAYFEDWDLCLRARNSGSMTVLVPAAIVSHRGSATTGHQSGLFCYLMTRNRYCLAYRHLPLPVFIGVFLPYFLCSRVVFKLLQLMLERNREGIHGVFMALGWILAPSVYRDRFGLQSIRHIDSI